MPAILNGIPRKVALVTINLTAIGWLLVVVGFGIAIDKNELILLPVPPNNLTPDQHDRNAYLYWSVCITGPVMILAANMHAILWQPFSSIVGAVSSVLMVLFLTGLGMILQWNGDNIRNSIVGLPPSFKLEFAGAVIATLFSALTMILWHFYDYEHLKSAGVSFLRGIARKVVLPFIFLTGIGWLLVVVGFAIAIHKDGLNNKNPESYHFWVVSVGGPFTIMAAFAHTILSKYPALSSAIGALTSFLSVFFLTGLGMMLYQVGYGFRITDSSDYLTSFQLMFSGAIVATTFFTAVLMLWHFYDFAEKRSPDASYSNIDLQAKRQPPPQPHNYGHTDL